jgi:hypothetical protein
MGYRSFAAPRLVDSDLLLIDLWGRFESQTKVCATKKELASCVETLPRSWRSAF